MRYTHVGSSRLEVSRLCLGTMNFGRLTPQQDAHQILDRALEVGINHLDTADMYGTPERPHASEEIIGAWLAQGGQRRERSVVATKVYEPSSTWPNHGGLSALNIRRACEASLRRLQTDHIDIYQMHHVDHAARWEEVWEAFDVLRTQGKILYVGSSNFAGWHLASAQAVARQRGVLPLISEQSVYNLAQRSIELEVLPAAQGLGIGVLAWSPLSGGLFAGPGSGTRGGGRRHEHQSRHEQHSQRLQATSRIAEHLGISLPVLAIAWLLSRPGVVAPVIGPRTVEQLETLLPAVQVQLGADVIAQLDNLWPGPGRAPEAYAW